MIDYEESDQAGMVGDMVHDHLLIHGGKPDESCEWCRAFILESKEHKKLREAGHRFHSYFFVIFDVSDPNTTKCENIHGDKYNTLDDFIKDPKNTEYI